MVVSFDPNNGAECLTALRLIHIVQGDDLFTMFMGHSEPDIPTAAPAEAPAAPAPTADVPATAAPTAVANGVDPAPAPAVDATAGVELDVNGTPWIAEVHAGTKNQNKDGSWKAKRGVDADFRMKMEQEARAKIAGTPTPTPPPADQPVVPPSEEPAAVVTMDDVSTAWQAAVAAGVVDGNGIMAVYAQIGVDPGQLNTNETMRASLVNYLNGQMQPQPADNNVVHIPGMPTA